MFTECSVIISQKGLKSSFFSVTIRIVTASSDFTTRLTETDVSYLWNFGVLQRFCRDESEYVHPVYVRTPLDYSALLAGGVRKMSSIVMTPSNNDRVLRP